MHAAIIKGYRIAVDEFNTNTALTLCRPNDDRALGPDEGKL